VELIAMAAPLQRNADGSRFLVERETVSPDGFAARNRMVCLVDGDLDGRRAGAGWLPG
jgi:hypothetical protein